MSTTVDNRVVEMQFDNRNFESNVKTSLSTLEKLKQSLNLKGAAKGLEDINTAAKNTNLSGLGSAVETVRAKFSALQVIGVTALANITTAAINTGAQMLKSLTLDPIIQGFQEYETQMNSVQTILSNTRTKGTTLDDVNGALDELNKYADQTIYNFTEMTRNIGTFTAAGVDLETSVNAIQGIANLAAISGSNSMQASTAMYQLSQALAAGRVSLMDWNSVVNAGMGGEVFQNALIKTSEELETGAEAAIKANGSFRESLQTGWMTSEVLTETLKKFTTSGATEYVAEYTGLSTEAVQAALDSAEAQYGEAEAIDKAAEALANKSGKSKEEIKNALALAKDAQDAATKVKTFSQLMDTLKEAVGSGWAQTWEIIFGDFEEAKELFTGISDVVGGFINKMSEARNSTLQEWKDLGGRTALLESFKNIFEGIGTVIKPIAEAFGEVFEPLKGETLANACKSLQEFTSHLKLSDETAANLKSTFKGVFSVIEVVMKFIGSIGKGVFDIFSSIVSTLTGFSGGLLEISGAIGEWLSGVSSAIDETNFFGSIIEKVSGFITGIIAKIKEFGNSLAEAFSISTVFDGFVNVFQTILDIITQTGSALGEAFSSISSGVSDGFSDGGFFELLNGGLFAAILAGIAKFVHGLTDPFEGVGGLLENITGVLDDVRGCFEAYQNNLRADTLFKIASAIGILAASLFVLSTIDADSLASALVGISFLFAELIGGLALFNKISLTGMLSVVKAVPMMLALSTAILILSGALKMISTVDWEGLAKGLIGIGGLLVELALFLNFAQFGGAVIRTSTGIVILSTALVILSKAVENFGSMEWESIGKGLAAVGGLLAGLAAFSHLVQGATGLVSIGIAMVLVGSSMKIFASVMKDLSGFSWEEISRSLVALGGALVILAAALHLMNGTLSGSAAMIIAAGALTIMASAVKSFSGLNWDEIARGLVLMGGALLELSIGLNLMNGSIPGSAALIIAAAALAILAPVMRILGGLSWEGIARGLVALAGAFAVIGVAGLLLGPLVPTLLGLSAAIGIFGAAVLGIGAGLTLMGIGITAIATGITALAASVATGATAIVAGLTVIVTGFMDLIPTIAEKLGEGIVAFAKVIGECAPQLAEAFLQLLSSVMESLATHVPQIASSLLELLVGVINSLSEHVPTLIQAFVNLLGSVFQGVVDALNGADTTNILKGVLAVGLMTALAYALSGIVALIPSAMVGLLGVGVLIAELSLVLAAIGALSQIPGLQWLVDEGGDFLQSVGTAIGQFVGGIAGGFMEGVSSSFPQIATDLSSFMTNLQPFIDGAANIDPSMMDGVKSLAEAIMMLTAADLMNGITSLLTGGSSLSDFAKQLAPFGEGMKAYGDAVSGINAGAIVASAAAAKAIVEVAKAIPSEGGLWGLLAGEKDLGSFGTKLIPFGQGMKAYSATVAGINTAAIVASAEAAKAIVEVANAIPSEGGLWQLLSGEKDLSSFGEELIPFARGMKAYAEAVTGINTAAIIASVEAAKGIVDIAKAIPPEGGLWQLLSGEKDLSSFGEKLAPFGRGMKAYAIAVTGIDTAAIMASVVAARALVSVANIIPLEGGFWQLVTGEKDLGSFGQKLVPFGQGMKAYAMTVAGIDTAAIMASVSAAAAMASVANAIPSEGGLWQLLSGEKDLSSFGKKLAPFGRGMKAYATAVAGIDTASILSSVNAARALVSVAKAIPPEGGLWSIIDGDKDLANFGKKLVPFGKGMKSYATSVAGLDTASIVASASAAVAMVSVANAIPSEGGFWGWITGEKDLSSFGEKLVPFGRAMKSYSSVVVGINTGAITSSVPAAIGMVIVAKAIPNNLNIGAGPDAISAFGSKMKAFGSAMKSYSISVAGINSGVITSSVTAAKQIVSLIKSTAGLNTSGVQGFVNAINTLGKAQVGQFINAFRGASSQMESAGRNMIQALIGGLKSGQGMLNTLAASMINSVANAVNDRARLFNVAGRHLMQQLTLGMQSMSSFVSSVATSALTRAAGSIRGYYGDFYSAGSYVASGLAAGIRSQISAAETAASALAAVAEKAARARLKINSPSKVFKEIGSGVPEGFIVGIGMLGNRVRSATTSMSDVAINGTKKAISRITDILDTDMDTQPTIRPVIDLSDIESGKAAISNMLSLNPSVGVMSNIGAITASMRRRNQNGVNDDVVSAIDRLRKDVGNLENRSYNLGDITYSSGDEISDALETIVRYATIERRV